MEKSIPIPEVRTKSDKTGFAISQAYRERTTNVLISPEQAPRILAELEEYVKSCQLKSS